VADRLLGIPAVIDVNGKQPQAQFRGLDAYVARIHAAAYPDDAIVVPGVAVPFDFIHQEPEPSLAFCLWQHALLCSGEPADTVVAIAGSVENYVRIAGVHDAAGADLVWACHPASLVAVGNARISSGRG